jgi:hypothetical protein
MDRSLYSPRGQVSDLEWIVPRCASPTSTEPVFGREKGVNAPSRSPPQLRLIQVRAERSVSGCPVSTAPQAAPSIAIVANSAQCWTAFQPRFL